MLPAMLAHGYKMGVGVDENTAAIVTGGNQVEVIGYKGALVVDLSEAKTGAPSTILDVRNAKLTYLGRGDQYDLKTKSLVVSTDKAQRKLDASKPSHKTVRLYGDILGNTTVVDVMQNLIDNVQTEAIGLAFAGPTEPQPELGFEFRFRKGPDSAGYDTGKVGGEDNTVLNIYLDVVPVEMALPLYRPRTGQ
jgi:cyanophycinase